jgi:rod shape-determining protein MreB
MVENRPKEVEVTPEEIRKAIREPVLAVVETIKRVLVKTAPNFIEDVKRDGIIMAGGGSLLQGLHLHIQEETGLQCRLTEDPLTTIVEGSGIVLENLSSYQKVFIN